MPTRSEEVDEAFVLVDTATTALGARVQILIDQINATATSGLNGPQTEGVLAHLAQFKAVLDAMGANPSNPLPALPPTPPAIV